MKRLLCIGINYTNTRNELPDCELDAFNMAALYQQRGWQVDVYKEMDGVTLLEILQKDTEAMTEKDEKGEENEWALYYSGHGSQFASALEADGYQGGICLWTKERGSIQLFPDQLLQKYLAKFKCPVTLILDACFSTEMAKSVSFNQLRRKSIPFSEVTIIIGEAEKKEAKAKARTKSVRKSMLFASAETEPSLSTGQGGMFTLGLLAAVESGLTAPVDILKFTTKQCGDNQHPQLRGSGVAYKTKSIF
jgi:hypothetical protein